MSIIVQGQVRVWKNGQLVAQGKNRVVDSGLALIANIFTSTATGRINSLAFATNAATPTATQVKLSGTEKGRRRVSVSRSAALITFTATMTGVSATLREFGLFNATTATGGTMLSRWISSAISLATIDSLRVAWSIQFGTG